MKKIITAFLLFLGMFGFSFAMSNPASWYCTNHGGKEVTKKHSDGSQYTLCVFDNGSSCEEWAFYNGKCSKRTESQVNQYCKNHGGTVNGSKCVFDHGKTCNKTDFYNHKCSKYNPQPSKPSVNPAKKYCSNMGGTISHQQDKSGYNYDLCVLPTGTECGLWQYYNGTCQNTGSHTDPMSKYCKNQGGELDYRNEPSGGKYEICKFSNGTECEVSDLYYGRCQKGDRKFNQHIKKKVNEILHKYYKNARHQHLLKALKNVDQTKSQASSKEHAGILDHVHKSLKNAAKKSYHGLGATKDS